MVLLYGFSKLGPIALDSGSSEVFLGRDLIHTRAGYAQVTGKAIDEEVRSLCFKAMEYSISLLTERREDMDRIVEALIEEEVLDQSTFLSLAGLK